MKKNILLFLIIPFIQISFALQLPSLIGVSGTIQTPNPNVGEVGKFAFFYWRNSYSFTLAKEESYNYSSFGVNYIPLPGLEMGFQKRTNSNDRIPDDGVLLYMKYAFPDTSFLKGAVGLLADVETDHYSSIFLTFGDKKVHFGVGANVAGEENSPYNPAPMGGYDFDKNKPEPFFFFIGATLDFPKDISLNFDYNGDCFSVGFDWKYDKQTFLRVFYRSDSDYDDLMKIRFGTTYSRDKIGFMVGGLW